MHCLKRKLTFFRIRNIVVIRLQELELITFKINLSLYDYKLFLYPTIVIDFQYSYNFLVLLIKWVVPLILIHNRLRGVNYAVGLM